MSEYKFPIAVALSEVFLWNVFLTPNWDHIFRNKNPEHEITDFPILPRELSFCPTVRDVMEYSRRSRKDNNIFETAKMIHYEETSLKAEVFIVMRKEEVGRSVLWYPDLITLRNIPILNKKIAEKIGYSSISVTDLIVWEK